MFKNGNGSKKHVESERREERMFADAQQKILNSSQWLTADQLYTFAVSTGQNLSTTPNECNRSFPYVIPALRVTR